MNGPQDDSEARREAVLRAMVHPLRRRILQLMQERDEPLAPIDLTRHFSGGEHEQPELSSYAYHFKVLRDLGVIVLAEVEPIRGSVKHMYRPAEAFAEEVRDSLALDRIAELVRTGGGGVLQRVKEVVASTGRSVG